MTFPPVIRIFFAVDLPLSVKEKLGQFIGQLKKKSKSNAIRWTKPENLHITLQFLAEVRAEHLTTLLDNVRANVEGAVKNSTFTFGALHLFPNPYRPRVIVLDITPQEQMAALASLIGDGIKISNYEVETRPFRGHLTLGRIKHAQGVNLNFLSEVSNPELEAVALEEVVLFRSEPQEDGSKYTPLDRIGLREHA